MYTIHNFNRLNIFDAFVRIARKHGAKMPFYPMADAICSDAADILAADLNMNHAKDRETLVQQFNQLTGASISLKDMPRKDMVQKCTELLEVLKHIQECPEFLNRKVIMPDLIDQPSEDNGPEHMAAKLEFTYDGKYFCFTSSDRDSFESLNNAVSSKTAPYHIGYFMALPEIERQIIVEQLRPDGKTICVSEMVPSQAVSFDALDGFNWNICDNVSTDTDMSEAMASRQEAYNKAAEQLWNNIVAVKPAVAEYTISFKRN